VTAGTRREAGRQAQIEGQQAQIDTAEELSILSLELPAETVLAGTNSDSGQELGALAPLVDRIYAGDHRGGGPPALETAVKAASAACGFVPELTEQPAEGTENWLLIQK